MKTLTAISMECAIKKSTNVIAKTHTLGNCAKLQLVRFYFHAIKLDYIIVLVQVLRNLPN